MRKRKPPARTRQIKVSSAPRNHDVPIPYNNQVSVIKLQYQLIIDTHRVKNNFF